MPRRTELVGAHRKIVELGRQVRRLRDDIGRGRGPKEAATATARPAAKKPATEKAAARKPAAKKAAVKEPVAVQKKAAGKMVNGTRRHDRTPRHHPISPRSPDRLPPAESRSPLCSHPG